MTNPTLMRSAWLVRANYTTSLLLGAEWLVGPGGVEVKEVQACVVEAFKVQLENQFADSLKLHLCESEDPIFCGFRFTNVKICRCVIMSLE